MMNSSIDLHRVDSTSNPNIETSDLRKKNKHQNEEIQMENQGLTNDMQLKPSPVLIDADQSSFEETLGIVPNKDDPQMLCLTFRSCIIGLFLTVMTSYVTTYIFYRSQISGLESGIAILLAYPLGKFFVLILPKHQWFKDHWYSFSLNPGPFTIKEHALIYSMAYISAQPITSCDLFILISRSKAEDTPPMPNYVVGLIFVLCTQLLGYGLARNLCRILVWPSEMIWVWLFPYMVTLRTMHEKESPLSPRWLGLTRHRFFLIILIFAFIYQWFPLLLFPKLNSFPWWCLINQNSTVLSQLTGPAGLAMGLIPLNWYQFLYPYMSPLTQPWWAYANMIIGFVLVGWILIPVLYYSNVLNWSKLPIIGNAPYLSPNDENNVQYPVGTAIVTYLYFAVFLSLLVHTFLYHGRDILKYSRTSLKNRQNDVHCTLISQYKEVPTWMYRTVYMIAFVSSCLVCHFCDFMPWYYMFLTVALSIIFTIPISIVQAQAGVSIEQSDTALLMLGGLIFHNQPISNSTFVIFTYNIERQAVLLLQNFKLAHYMKISPRILFVIQLVSTVISSTIAYITTRYLISNEKNFCNDTIWACSDISSDFDFYSTTDLSKLFGLKSVYPWLLWVMVAVGFSPIFFWIAQRLFSNIEWIKSVHIPVMFMYLANLSSPGSGYVSFPSWLLLGVIFRKIIRRWWFDRYAFLFQMSMIMGTFFAMLFYLFIFAYNDIRFPDWWGIQTDMCPLAYANLDGNIPRN